MTPFPYDHAETEEVPCNLCGGRHVEVVGERDRNGLAQRSVICTHCGLIFLSPRMTPAWYARYYQVEYRRQMAAFHGGASRAEDPQAVFRRQLDHGAYLASYLTRTGQRAPRSVLEVGSSAGGILRSLADAFGVRVLGIEPSPEEAAFAERQGVPTRVGLFEDVELPPGQSFDLVLCTQSFNHLLDPRGVARKVHSLLAPDGVFLLECQNFFHLCRYWGDRTRAIQIDHTFMFVPQTLQAMLAASGLDVLPEATEVDEHQPAHELRQRRRAGAPSLHVRLLACRSSRVPSCVPRLYPAVKSRLDRLSPAPLRAALARRWELQMMRLDRLRGYLATNLR